MHHSQQNTDETIIPAKRNTTFLCFLVVCLVAWLVGLFPLLKYTPAQIFTFINSYHSPKADLFFAVITYTGTGWVIVPILLLLMLHKPFRNKRFFLLMTLCNIVPSIVTHIIKNFLHRPRPLHFFQQETWLYFPEGQPLQYTNSFPSGHTEAVFALCCFLSLILPDKYKWTGIILFSVAALTAYSRIYLVQHFYTDVYAGSIIGVVFCLLTFYIFPKKNIVQ